MTTEVEVTDAPIALYRLYSGDGKLLYVGITGHLKVRLAEHAKDKPWWPEVMRKTAIWLPTKHEAMDAEAAAIRDERPRYNVTEPALLSAKRYGRNKNPLLGWHPPAELSAWVRSEAARQGRLLSELLTEALEQYRRQTGSAP